VLGRAVAGPRVAAPALLPSAFMSQTAQFPSPAWEQCMIFGLSGDHVAHSPGGPRSMTWLPSGFMRWIVSSGPPPRGRPLKEIFNLARLFQRRP
jgi:hypothetical protein